MKVCKMEATLIDHMGSDLSVVNAARVSFHKVAESFKEGDKKLIQYLAKHKHFSPFNHAFMSFRVKAPIFVARQLVKHKFMPWNEVSRRYVDEEPEFYMPEVWRAKADNVKQGSRSDANVHSYWYGPYIEKVLNGSIQLYDDMLSDEIAPEMARMVLPQNMMTEWVWSGSLGAFADMLKLRLDPHTQAESREVAQMIYEQIEPLFPVSINALLENK